MLILSRRVGEKLVVPEFGITVEIFQVQGRRVRLGIEAPLGVTVLRSELLEPVHHQPEAPAKAR